MRGDRRRVDPPRGRASRGGRLRVLTTSVILLGGATALILAGAGGTTAFLLATEETDEAVVTAGTMQLSVDGSVSADLGVWQLTPATPQARAFTVALTGQVPGTLSALLTATSSTAITANTQARLTPVASPAACVVGLSGPLAALDGYSRVAFDTLTAGQSKTYCLELRLTAGAAVAQSGQGVAFRLTLDAAQVP